MLPNTAVAFQEEAGESLPRCLASNPQEPFLHGRKLPVQDIEQALAQSRRRRRELSQPGLRDGADAGPVDRLGAVGVTLAHREPHQIAGEEECDDLPAPVRRRLVAGDGAIQHPMEAVGGIALQCQRFMRLQVLDDADSVEPVEPGRRTLRQWPDAPPDS